MKVLWNIFVYDEWNITIRTVLNLHMMMLIIMIISCRVKSELLKWKSYFSFFVISGADARTSKIMRKNGKKNNGVCSIVIRVSHSVIFKGNLSKKWGMVIFKRVCNSSRKEKSLRNRGIFILNFSKIHLWLKTYCYVF